MICMRRKHSLAVVVVIVLVVVIVVVEVVVVVDSITLLPYHTIHSIMG